jgi:hypothetical protein
VEAETLISQKEAVVETKIISKTGLTKYTLKDLNNKKKPKMTCRCHKMKVKLLTRSLSLVTEEVLGRVVGVVGISSPMLKMTILFNQIKVKLLTRGNLQETEEVQGRVEDVAGLTKYNIMALSICKLTMKLHMMTKNKRMATKLIRLRNSSRICKLILIESKKERKNFSKSEKMKALILTGKTRSS